jgi:hypothetical protein
MPNFTRDQFQSRLQNDWLAYLNRFDHLSPDGRQAFLEKQGYARIGSLLGHIIAWWQDGAQAIQTMRANPAFPLGDYDVDTFNARAVETFSQYDDAEVRQMYLAQAQAMLDLVGALTDAEINQDNINTRLYYEILSHWNEHALD